MYMHACFLCSYKIRQLQKYCIFVFFSIVQSLEAVLQTAEFCIVAMSIQVDTRKMPLGNYSSTMSTKHAVKVLYA